MSATLRRPSLLKTLRRKRVTADERRPQYMTGNRHLRLEQLEQRQLLSISVLDSSGVGDDASIQFMTPLSQFRPGAFDSPLVRPSYPDTQQYFDVTNSGSTPLTLSELKINVPDVSVDVPLTLAPGDDIVLRPDESQRFNLIYAPTRPNSSSLTTSRFALADGLILLSDDPDHPQLHIRLIGASTFNSDVNYDGKVNLGDLGILNANFGRMAGDANWDPTADVNGDGVVNLSELGSLNTEAWSDGIAPTIQAGLANDTAPGGGTNADRITSDPTFAGRVTDADGTGSLWAGFDNTPVGDFFDVSADLQPDGSFVFSRARLAEINRAPISDGFHTLRIIASDQHGNTSYQSLPFTLHTQLPTVIGKVPENVRLSSSSTTVDVFFSEPVFGVNRSDLVLTGAGAASATVENPINAGGNLWRFPARGLTNGAVNLALTPGIGDIEDLAGNPLAPVAWSFAVDTTPPTVTARTPDGATLSTSATNIDVTFSEEVRGVDATDLAVTCSNGASATIGTPFDLGGNTWRFPVTNLTEGPVDILLAMQTNSIEDLAGNDLAATSWGFAVDVEAPRVTARTLDGARVAMASVDIDVTFSEAVTGLNASDLILSGDAAVGAIVGEPTDLGQNTWRFPVSGLTDGWVNVQMAPVDDILVVDLWFNNDDGNLNLYIYDSNEQLLDSSTSTNGFETLSVPIVPGAGFYVQVTGADGATNPDYGLGFDAYAHGQTILPDAFEPNDSYDQAYDLGTGNQTLTGLTLHKGSHQDYYQWTAPADGVLHVDASFVGSEGNVNLRIEDSDKNFLDASVSDGDHEHVAATVIGGQTVYILAYGRYLNETTPGYDLQIELRAPDPTPPTPDRFEPDDGFVRATDLGTGDQYLTILSIHEAYNADFFTWTASVSGTMYAQVFFDSVVDDFDLTLYDANRQRVEGYYSDVRNWVQVSAQAAPGQTFFIRAVGWNGEVVSNYDLRIFENESGVTALAADPFEPNDSFAEATDLGAGDQDHRDLSVHESGNDDFFLWRAPLATNVHDIAGNSLQPAVWSFAVDVTAPTVTGTWPQTGTTLHTRSADVNVVLSEPVSGVQATDLVLTGAGAAHAVIGGPTKLGDNIWRFPVSGLTTGSVHAEFAAAPLHIVDRAGNQLAGAPVTWDFEVDVSTIIPADLEVAGLGFTINGAAPQDYSGYVISGAGDFNGDGLSDLIVGAPCADPNGPQCGAAYVVYGPITTGTIKLSNLVADGKGTVITGAAADDLAGFSVSGAGDINGDGLADIIVGAPYADPGGYSNAGTAYVVFGSPTPQTISLASLATDGKGIAINGRPSNDNYAGYSVASAGDVDGDGLSDVVVGAPNAYSYGGEAYIVFGTAGASSVQVSDLVSTSKGIIIQGNSGMLAGYDVSGAGDVNGDGLTDVIIGSPSADLGGTTDTGTNYVVFGAATSQYIYLASLVTTATGIEIRGFEQSGKSGRSVSGAGDVNGDGFTDLVVGTRKYVGPNDEMSDQAYIVFGNSSAGQIALSTLVADSKGILIDELNEVSGSQLNYVSLAVAGAGDVNGDGLADVVLGSSYSSPNGWASGLSYVVFGVATPQTIHGPMLYAEQKGFLFAGSDYADLSGNGVSGAGDVNGDGVADIAVGAPFASPAGRSDAGQSYVLFGPGDSGATQATWVVRTKQGNSPPVPLGTTGNGSNYSTPDSGVWIDFNDASDTSGVATTQVTRYYSVAAAGVSGITQDMILGDVWHVTTTRTAMAGTTITFDYPESQVGALRERDFRILYSADGQNWQALPRDTSRISRNQMQATVDHFGWFVIDHSVPAGPSVSLLSNGGNVNDPAVPTHDFVVHYDAHDELVNAATINGQDVLVTGPNGFSQLASFVNMTPAANSQVIDVTYRMTAPGGTWDYGDMGTYILTMQANQVSDVRGVSADPKDLGQFVVDLPVAFADPDLESAVKNALGITPSAPVLASNMSQLVSLSADSNIIDSLQGLQLAVNLKDLKLWPTNWSDPAVSITDLSPLSGLALLEQLTLARAQISEAQLPALAGLHALQTLDLRYNRIQDVSAIASLTQLKSLYLYGNPLTSTTALAGMNLALDLLPADADKAKTVAELAAALGYSPLRIYEYVYNNFEFQPYAGLMKGAQAVLETKAGNSWDISALLIELLKTSGVSARFATGRINANLILTFRWLGINTSTETYRLLAEAGLNPVLALGGIQPLVSFDHTWVEAYLPASNGVSTWIAMDAACKFKDYREGVPNLLTLVPFDDTGYISQIRPELPYEYYEDQVSRYLTANMPGVSLADVGYDGPIIQKAFDAIPDALPYGHDAAVTYFDAYANVPLSWKHTGELTIKQNATELLHQQFVLPDMCLERVTVSYVPVPEQQAIVNGYGGLANTPAGAVNVIPQLKLDGQLIAQGSPVSYLSSIDIVLAQSGVNGAHHTADTYPRKAGQYIAVGFNTLQISDTLLAKQVQLVNQATIAETNGQPFNTDDQIGGLLYYAMMKYYANCGLADSSIEALTQFSRVLWKVETGITTADLAVTRENNLQFPVVPRGALIDVAGGTGVAGAFARGSGDEATINQMRKHGIYNGSALEHAIWQELINTESISTVKSLELANQRGIPVFVIDSSNASTYIPQLTLSAGTKASIQSEVNNGSTVTTPRDLTPLGDWTGVGYFVFNPNYSAAIISGGYSSSEETFSCHGGYTTGSPSPYSPPYLGNSWGSTHAGDPVNIANGNLIRDEKDVSLPGIGVPLEFTRHYDSQSEADIGMGRGWVHSYSDFLASGSDNKIIWIDREGRSATFTPDGHGGYTVPEELDGTFTASANGFVYRSKEGMTHKFDTAGRLIEIGDRNGNSLTIAYDGNGHITTVTDTDTSARQLTFTWSGSHITAVTDFAGRTWSYDYSGDRLIRVTSPSDAQTPAAVTRYDYYDGTALGGMIRQITEPNEGTTTYSYYPNKRVFAVTDAEGHTQHYYYNLCRNLTTFVNESSNPTVYIHNDKGNPLKVIYADRSRESYTWVHTRMESWTDPFGKSETYQYDTLGNLTQLTGRDGMVTTLTYEPVFSNPLTVTRPGGRVTNYGYDPNGNRTSITDALRNVTTMTYDSRGLTLTKTRPKGNLTPVPGDYTTTYTYNDAGEVLTESTDLPATLTNTYDTRGNKLSVTDADGYTTTNTYDLRGRLTQTVDPLSHAKSFTYDTMGNQLTVTDALGNITTNNYDRKGKLTKTIHPDGTYVTFAYDATGNKVLETDELGRPTRFGYNNRDRLVETIYPDGATTKTRYDGAGRTVATLDTAGYSGFSMSVYGGVFATIGATENATRFTYDAADRNLTTVDALGNTTTKVYDEAGNLRMITDPCGGVTTSYYDLLDRATQVRSPENMVQTLDYDANGNKILVTRYDVTGLSSIPDDPRTLSGERKRTSQTVFDVADRATAQIDPLGNSTHTYYDAAGRVLRTTDERGKDTVFTYDAVGNVRTRTNPDGGTVTNAYDAVYRRIGLTMPEGGTTTSEYDKRGRLIAEIDPLARPTKYYYDAVDTVLEQLNPDGSWIKKAYDARNRLVRLDQSDGSFETFSYDLKGNMTEARNEHSVVTLGYDALNRRTHESTSLTNDSFYASIDYQYDPEGNLTQVSDSNNGYVTSYVYDLAARLTSLTLQNSWTNTSLESAQIAYTGFGQRGTITYGNGCVDTFSYDGAGRLASITYTTPGGASSIAYARDAAGNPITVTENLGGVAETLTITNDDMGRPHLVTAASNSARNETFTYDKDGNVIDTGALTGMTFDAADQAVSGSGGTYASDAQGNLTTTTHGDGSRIMTPCDPSNRITGILQYSAAGALVREVKYIYDALGRRVKIVDGSTTTYRTFAFDNMIAQSTSAFGSGDRYLMGPTMDDVFAAHIGGATRYLHRDEIGSVRLVTGPSGLVLATSSFSLYGRNVASTGANDTGLSYAARMVDPQTGLIDMRARMYDPAMARFYSEDPVSTLSKGLSLYSYAGNQPLDFIDPTGRSIYKPSWLKSVSDRISGFNDFWATGWSELGRMSVESSMTSPTTWERLGRSGLQALGLSAIGDFVGTAFSELGRMSVEKTMTSSSTWERLGRSGLDAIGFSQLADPIARAAARLGTLSVEIEQMYSDYKRRQEPGPLIIPEDLRRSQRRWDLYNGHFYEQ